MSDRGDAFRELLDSQHSDLVRLICAEMLGEGISRKVFVYRLQPERVVKLEYASRFQNVLEWEIWCCVSDHKELAKWFAPCFEISGLGQWLIQARTHPIEKVDLPKKVPTVFTDLKPENWGWFEGRPVCHDYGTAMCRLLNASSGRLRKADWY